MIATAVNLETRVDLTQEQLDRLQHQTIYGTLSFSGNLDGETFTNDIPLQLRYNPKQAKTLIAEMNPSMIYFGNAKEIIFTFNLKAYTQIDNGGFSANFFDSGKLHVKKRGSVRRFRNYRP